MHLRSKGCLQWGVNEMPLIVFLVFFFKLDPICVMNDTEGNKVYTRNLYQSNKNYTIWLLVEKNPLSCVCVCVCVSACSATQSCQTLGDPMDCSLPDSSVRGILQARILEGVVSPPSRRSSWPRGQTHISCVFCIGQVGSLPLSYLGSPIFLTAHVFEGMDYVHPAPKIMSYK